MTIHNLVIRGKCISPKLSFSETQTSSGNCIVIFLYNYDTIRDE